jgi:hypothetical protein
MKRVTIYFSAVLIALSLLSTGCSKKTVVITGTHKKVPPGQMKKMTGSKSAKPFAPGQQKKMTSSKSGKASAPGQQKKQ